ncbi:hypothetical protein V2I01_36010 [Micromonospora sp. BRA006-A]|nr:hypothetical protein [Micromonospora sp. BRA006-A]
MRVGILTYHFPPEPAFVPAAWPRSWWPGGTRYGCSPDSRTTRAATSIPAGGSAGGTRRTASG